MTNTAQSTNKQANSKTKWFVIIAIISLACMASWYFIANNNKEKVAALQEKTEREKTYQLIEWMDLLPEHNLKALLEGKNSLLMLEGALGDEIESEISMKIDNPQNDYERALISTEVIEDYHEKKIKLPGFIVPTDIQGEGITTEFFFVPFFGACLHLPPPPPNQIIYAKFPAGYEVSSLEEPHYIEATIYTKTVNNELVTAAYTADVDYITKYYQPTVAE